MSLKDFQTYLWPETKVGKIGFYQKPTVDNPNGQVLEADFSRVDAGDTSGATVFRDGVLIELAENEPDWDDSSGCPVLKMRPQAQNLIVNALFNGVGTDIAPTEFIRQDGGDGSIEAENSSFESGNAVRFITPTNSRVWLLGSYSVTNTTNYSYTFYVEQITVAGSVQNALLVLVGGTITGYLEDGVLVSGATIMQAGKHYTVLFTTTSVNIQIRLGIVSNSIANYVLSMPTLALGSKPVDFIPTTTAPLTRSSNSFQFTDLVTKGVISANGHFTMGINIENGYIHNGANAACILFKNSSGTNIFLFNAMNSGLTPVTQVPFAYIDVAKVSKKIIFSFDGNNFKMYYNSAKQIDYNFTTSGNVVSRIDFINSGNYSSNLKPTLLAPIVLTEAQAIAALNEL